MGVHSGVGSWKLLVWKKEILGLFKLSISQESLPVASSLTSCLPDSSTDPSPLNSLRAAGSKIEHFIETM